MAPPTRFVLQGVSKRELGPREHAASGGHHSRPTKVLVIDDDAAVMMIITATLRGAGYSIVQAYGGEDAIRKARTHKPGLVLTDLEMPGVNGVDVITALRADPETEHIPIVAVTSHVWDVIAQSAGQKGCDGYLSKPFLPAQLLAMVHKFLPPIPKSR